MITYKKSVLRICEVWFDEDPSEHRADIFRYFQRANRMSAGGWTPFWTILLDLTFNSDVLLNRMSKETRYEIRRAVTQDKNVFQCWTDISAGQLAAFRAFHDEWAAQPLTRTSYVRLKALAADGRLVISQVVEDRGSPLVWHAYLVAPARVRLLHSVSALRGISETARRSMLGRANRFHHWNDILFFQERGFQNYDFGGWYSGQSDAKGLSLNRFKEGFGGEIVVGYNGICGLSFAGKAAVWLYSHMRQRTILETNTSSGVPQGGGSPQGGFGPKKEPESQPH